MIDSCIACITVALPRFRHPSSLRVQLAGTCSSLEESSCTNISRFSPCSPYFTDFRHLLRASLHRVISEGGPAHHHTGRAAPRGKQAAVKNKVDRRRARRAGRQAHPSWAENHRRWAMVIPREEEEEEDAERRASDKRICKLSGNPVRRGDRRIGGGEGGGDQ